MILSKTKDLIQEYDNCKFLKEKELVVLLEMQEVNFIKIDKKLLRIYKLVLNESSKTFLETLNLAIKLKHSSFKVVSTDTIKIKTSLFLEESKYFIMKIKVKSGKKIKINFEILDHTHKKEVADNIIFLNEYLP